MDKKRLMEFARAWQMKDIEKVMSFFTEDCSYFPSVGPNIDTSFVGKEQVSAGIRWMMDRDEVKDVVLSAIRIDHDFGFWKWTYVLKDGGTEVGCDVFEFSGPLIKVKNAFRKVTVHEG